MKKTGRIAAVLVLVTAFFAASALAWPVPDTGQTKCYDDKKEIPCPKPGEPYYGQDGNYSINPMSFTKLDERGRDLPDSASKWTMVRDNVTGLIWEVKTDDGSIHDKDDTYDWEKAQSVFIAQLNRERFGGYSDAEMFGKKMDFTVTELYGKDATRRAIIRAIADVQGKSRKNDGLVFYFAGHGQGIELKNRNLEGYIIPYDADLSLESAGAILFDEEAISLSRLRTYAQDFSARHIALILDSCFSGLAMKRSIPRFPPMTADYYNDLLSRKAINILTAGDDHPVSDGTGHSPFTQALLYALERGNIDLHDRDGFATFNQLAVYVKEKVEKATGRRQRPQFDNLSMDDGEFVFQIR